MSGHTNNYQTIEFNGAPAFVLVPVEDFRKIQPLLANAAAPGGIPHAVVKANIVEGKRLVRAWREHLGKTQDEVAAKAGISQPALAKIERPGARPTDKKGSDPFYSPLLFTPFILILLFPYHHRWRGASMRWCNTRTTAIP